MRATTRLLNASPYRAIFHPLRPQVRHRKEATTILTWGDTEDSDLDILIDPTPDTTLLDIGAIRHELLQLLGVPVDVLTPKALPERSRATVLAEALPV
jgi:hypothetical protein